MKRPPIDFENRLGRLFDNRLRIRWSNKRDEWHIEYKVSVGKQVSFYTSGYDDAAIRARDGYAYLMSVCEGDRTACPRCGYTVKVPKFEIGHARCEYCKLAGKDGRFTACYFPLDGDTLIQHLAKLDPLKGWRDKLHLMADQQNDRLIASRERDCMNQIEAGTKDHFNKLVGIQSVGYTGKELT